ncbi:AAEL006351-PA [Aedes aegypti]|uniref:AAEL006351-PA n=2 Tax=Aedes aegypti TaxID=7159 RepID=A0A1S4FDB2_AEDAE|nr:uncharacterized protein LOC5567871 isoform X1 [Aedes aegypti]EAT42064.1 AAEL006351-PA [Aedes aegypti]
MQTFACICLISILISESFGKFDTAADPVFSDDVTDYDSPSGIDYYDVKDYPMIPGEWNVYRKTKPGGLLPRSDADMEGKTISSKEITTTSRYIPTRQPRVQNKSRKPARFSTVVPIPTAALTAPQCILQRTTPKPLWRREGGRVIIDGSDPNIDIFKVMREARRRPTEAPKPTGNLPMRDIVGNEIKPETASNQFLVLGNVRRCREIKQEDHEHRTRNSRVENSDPTVTGLTVEYPPNIKWLTHRFESTSTGGKSFVFRTMNGKLGFLKMKWYSCPTRTSG